MLVRTFQMFVVSGALLFTWDLWWESGSRKVAIWQGLGVSLAAIVFLVSGGIVGLLAYLAVVAPFLPAGAGRWTEFLILPGILLGAWGSNLLTQLLSNAARRICGKPVQKLVFFGHPAGKKWKKAAARRPAEH